MVRRVEEDWRRVVGTMVVEERFGAHAKLEDVERGRSPALQGSRRTP